MSIRVSIVEDDPGILDSLAVLINESEGFNCVAKYRSGEEALAGIPRDCPDVLLADINLPKISGVECVRRLKSLLPNLQVVMLTVYENSETVFEALEAGATGYLLKRTDPAKILDAIRDVHEGGAPMTSYVARKVVQSFVRRRSTAGDLEKLSAREEEILALVAGGYHNKEIGEKLRISTETVRVHLRNIYEKLHVGSRSEAVAKFLTPARG